MNKLFGGRVKIETICRKTGEVLDTFGPDSNMVVDEGIRYFFQRLTTNDSGNGLAFNSIAVGTDFGAPADWSEFNPEPPNRKLIAEDQDVIYFTPFANMVFEYPVQNVIKITGLIDGVEAMTQSFPTEYSAVFNSATLRFGNGRIFAYKRFPARYISRDVDIRIVWTLTMQNASTFCGFKDPVDDGNTFVYFGSQIEVFRLDADGNLVYSFTHHENDISAIEADIAGFIYTGDDNGLLNKQDTGRNILWGNTMNDGAVISGIDYDDLGNVYVTASNGDVRKLTEYSGQLWAVNENSAFIYLSGVDSDGYTYAYNSQTGSLKKYSQMGSTVWENTDDHTSAILDASTANSGNTFTISADDTLRMFNTDGDLLWDEVLSETPSCVSFDPESYVVVAFSSTRLEKYNLSGTLEWSITDLPDWSTHLTVDNDGSIYVATQNNEVHKYSRDGVHQWTYDAILAPVNALAVNRN